ncbi:zinc finger CCCH domain-containing protein [Salix suchowensis]|nr:zinc finger CCCH domain-containing protein [Salix suchowensis]
MQHQDLINRSALDLARLREVTFEMKYLRQENADLRSINRELNNQLIVLIQASLHKQNNDSTRTPFDIDSGFHNLCNISSGGGHDMCEEDDSPTSVMEAGGNCGERISLHKGISVRFNSYSKWNQEQAASASVTRAITRPRTPSPPNTELARSFNASCMMMVLQQKVYERRGKKEESPELEVYSQGMFKTELCNKWQETGTCLYGNQCQFAHGIEELRPVIRHPRYKTEVCKMVLAGDICPYGHRCHFRHALTEQDRLFLSHIKPREIKPGR